MAYRPLMRTLKPSLHQCRNSIRSWQQLFADSSRHNDILCEPSTKLWHDRNGGSKCGLTELCENLNSAKNSG